MNENRLVLTTTKMNAIIDFIASIPEITTKAVTRKNILHSFIENGTLDSSFLRSPELNNMLATCRLDPTESEYKLCVESFPCLFKEHQE